MTRPGLRRQDARPPGAILKSGQTCWRQAMANRFALIVDDRFLKIGSSSLNNRSMGFDTECDLAIEASGDAKDKKMRAAIAAIADDLLAEHLGVEPGDFAAARRKAKGSLIAAIERLVKPRGRTLKPLNLRELNEAEKRVVKAQILDPERPAPLFPKLKRLLLARRERNR